MASRVKIVKWFLVGSLCLFCSAVSVRGDAAADLYNQGVNALNNGQYDDAAKAFQTIVTSYPTFQQIDNTRLLGGRAYFFAKKYTDAVTILQNEAASNAKPDFHAQGLFLTALAQFFGAQATSTPSKPDISAYTTDVATFTTLVNYIAQNPTPDNKSLLEQALYFRSLATYELNKYDASVQDLITLTTDPQYAQSLSRPDYLLQLGDIYSIQTSNLVGDKDSSPSAVNDLAQKAIATFDQVIADPNALVQANDANMSKAQVLVMLAQLGGNTSDGYQKALDAYRQGEAQGRSHPPRSRTGCSNCATCRRGSRSRTPPITSPPARTTTRSNSSSPASRASSTSSRPPTRPTRSSRRSSARPSATSTSPAPTARRNPTRRGPSCAA